MKAQNVLSAMSSKDVQIDAGNHKNREVKKTDFEVAISPNILNKQSLGEEKQIELKSKAIDKVEQLAKQNLEDINKLKTDTLAQVEKLKQRKQGIETIHQKMKNLMA